MTISPRLPEPTTAGDMYQAALLEEIRGLRADLQAAREAQTATVRLRGVESGGVETGEAKQSRAETRAAVREVKASTRNKGTRR